MKLTNLNRLLRLADLLRSLPKQKFDMTIWAKENSECGMVCCIGGWACNVHPDLRRIFDDHYLTIENKKTFTLDESAFQDAFELSKEDTYRTVFGNFRSPQTAANHIDRLAKRLAKENDFEIMDA